MISPEDVSLMIVKRGQVKAKQEGETPVICDTMPNIVFGTSVFGIRNLGGIPQFSCSFWVIDSYVPNEQHLFIYTSRETPANIVKRATDSGNNCTAATVLLLRLLFRPASGGSVGVLCFPLSSRSWLETERQQPSIPLNSEMLMMDAAYRACQDDRRV
ncbi:uncharacterized protein LOC134223086 [Armigeres subalbatus]|uniref:uncharacterized protein LOC134223086 n=1 Tax=Armigeres subalbatus TaxID=124917 RepID=UPI002ED5DF7B